MLAFSAVLAGGAAGCAAPPGPEVSVHYLGHASFLLTFDDTLQVLTDYGESNAYGLSSPVHPIGEARPQVVTLSHDHPDHAGGEPPPVYDTILRGQGTYRRGDLTITPIPTFEADLETPDNLSFLFEYRGLRILHLGDCQGLMMALGSGQLGIRERISRLYPGRYDLVLLPIGFVREILAEAAEFVALLDAGAVVPMHYWDPADRDTFLDLLEGQTDTRGRSYTTRREPGAIMRVAPGSSPPDYVEVMGLTPGPPDSL
jgi:L-ascorbate metabolism protein UlaG (beta-lactamase superfamily)